MRVASQFSGNGTLAIVTLGSCAVKWLSYSSLLHRRMWRGRSAGSSGSHISHSELRAMRRCPKRTPAC